MKATSTNDAAFGISGLDDVVGGGLARGRVFLLEGNPGTGKTTIATQFLIEGARAGERCLYITLSETDDELRAGAASHGWSLDGIDIYELIPPENLLDEQQQQSLLYSSDLELSETTRRIFQAFEESKPQRVVLDSLSEIRLLAQSSLRYRRQILALKHYFAQQQATVLMLDDLTADINDGTMHSVAHGVFRLEELAPDYGAQRRRLRVIKYRGKRFRGGFHDLAIETGGVRVFPRLVSAEHKTDFKRDLLTTTSPELNKLLGGGVNRGSSVLILGPAGTGKSILTLTFVQKAIERGEKAAMFVFDEERQLLIERALPLGIDLQKCIDDGALVLEQIDAAELTPGEFAERVRGCVEHYGARTVVIDSLNGYQAAMPAEHALILHMHELLQFLNRQGATTFLNVAQHGLVGDMKAPVDITYLADTVILLRYFEALGRVRRAVSIVKKRTGPHEDSIREYRIDSRGITVGEPLTNFQGILRGVPELIGNGHNMMESDRQVMRSTLSERGLVVAPLGRDASLAAAMLRDAGIEAAPCITLPALIDELNRGAAFVVVTEEALATADLHPLSDWLAAQEEWSDLPFILLTVRGGGLERNPAARRYLDVLGNVTFLERPFHPTTLISLAESALRGRRRQYQARFRIEQIRDSEARYRTLFTSMDEGFCVIEFFDGPHGPLSDYVHVEANAAYERNAGIPNVVGQKLREMVGGEADAWVARYRAVLVTGEPIRFEQELVATGRHLELSSFRIEPPERRQVAVLFKDVTERKRAENALRDLNDTLERRVDDMLAERKLLADLVEGTDAFVQVVDHDLRWLAINKASAAEFERTFGVSAKVGDRIGEVLAEQPENLAKVEAHWRRALAGDPYTEIAGFEGPGTDQRFYELKFNVLRGTDGEMIGAYQFVYDVTERLEDQAKLSEAEARMHEMAKLETLGQLTGGVAHDFNNLLTPIVGTLDLLRRRHDGDARSLKLISGAMQGAERAALLVQRLLSFARRQHLEARTIDVGRLVEGMRDLMQRSLGPHIAIEVKIQPGLPPARVDPNQLELALLNLAVNARDAMAGGGTLSVRIDDRIVDAQGKGLLEAGRYIRLCVADTGTGMDDATLRRAVEPFFTTKGLGQGTGLGLSMVHGLAAQSGGTMTLTSKPGEGTTAVLWLPVAVIVGEDDAGAADEIAPVVQPRRGHILLVDDEDLVRAATAEMLREMGHSVEEVSSPTAALDRLRAEDELDLLVTDYLMPQMRGSALVVEARRLRPDLPALLITGYADLSEGEAINLPRLAKPFREADLAREVARLMGSDRVSYLSDHAGKRARK